MNFDVTGANCDGPVPAARRLGDLVTTSTVRADSAQDVLAQLDRCLTAAGAFREQLARVDVAVQSADNVAELDRAWVAWMPHPETRPTRTVTITADATAAFTASAIAWSPRSL